MTTQYIYNMVDTWNDGATTFTSIKMDVTDSASNAASLLMDLQVGTVSKFSVTKAGNFSSNYMSTSATRITALTPLWLGSSSLVAFSSAFNPDNAAVDLFLTRRGTANLRLGAADTTGTTAPTPQFLSAQSWSSSTTNNQTGANFTIDGSQGTGTGAGGSIVFRVAPAGGTSNGVQNALATALTINSNKTVTMDAGVASAPSINFGDSTTGFFRAGAQIIGVTTNGTSFVRFDATNGVSLRSDANIGWASNTSYSSYDVSLFRDAANTLALRNGANAQTFRVYNTYDGTNDERGFIKWSSNVLQIGTDRTGTGAARELQFQTDGTTRMTIQTNGSIDATGNFNCGGSGLLYWLGRSVMSSPSNGIVQLLNNNLTGFDRLQFGGTDANFPALKRNGTALETKLANDTAYAPHAMQYLDVTDGVTAPASATGRARIYVDTADGDLKVIFADGTVKTIVTDT